MDQVKEVKRPGFQLIGVILKAAYILISFLISTASIYAQNVTRAEYFFDTDPGVGNGIPLTVPIPAETVTFSASISTAGLTSGRHLLYIRTRSESLEWSLYEPREFFIESGVDQAEYFIDTDPGAGNGIPITVPGGSSTFSAAISTLGITDGRHLLYIRTKSDGGEWSLYEPREFFVQGPIGQAEYFFDTDPGVGNATPVNISTIDDFRFNTSIIVPALPDGTHYLYMRIKEEGGTWSLYEPATITVGIPLPVELLSLTAKKNAEGFVDLNWTTASEKNNDYFEIERWIKDDPRFHNSFVGIGRVSGYGTSKIPHHYTYRDYTLQSKSIYYRLKQIDFDGAITYSNVVAVPSDGEPMVIKLFPNPTSSSFTLDVYSDAVDKLQVDITDESGKHIETHVAIDGRIDLGTHWAPGLYLVRIKNPDGVTVLKIVKIK